MAEASVPVKYLDDITECPICTNIFTDPRELPCVHTFCLKCIEGWAANRKPDEHKLACPLCRKEITVTQDDLKKLPKNLFVDRLLELIKSSCNLCEQHCDKPLEVYCKQCKVVVCITCRDSEHKTHDCTDVNEVAKEINESMRADCDRIDAVGRRFRDDISSIASKEKLVLKCATEVEREIENQAKKMKAAIERRRRELQEELMAVKQRDLKQIESARDDVQSRLLMIDSFNKYSEQLREKGSAVELAREADCLHTRADELVTLGSMDQSEIETRMTDASFISNKLSTHHVAGIFGKLNCADNSDKSPEDNFMSCKTPLHIVPSNGDAVFGVATLRDEIFVVRKSVKHISVYDATTMTEKRTLWPSSAAIGVYYGLVLCHTNVCLYVPDYTANLIHKVNVDGNKPSTCWPVAGKQPVMLSLTANANILVVYWELVNNRIHEYSSIGVMVREIILPQAIGCVAHAVELPDGCLGITHEVAYGNQYCVVDAGGQVIRNYGGLRGSGYGQLNRPRGLAIDKYGFVYIADRDNNRVLVLDPTTFVARKLPVDGGFSEPFCIHIDKIHGRMYIGERAGGRIIVLGT